MATINPDLHHKFRNVTKLPSRPVENGNQDVREDEDQSIKLQEIVDLLVAAGYFRARIKGLSSFDKIVGGMTWCIESCNVDIDVDLLFQENSTIGQKIALTEKIVAVLPKMKCPHRIEPHQIQGLDCVHIFPIIQWLVKRSMEVRQEMSAFVHSYAVNQFNKEFPIENKHANAQKQVLTNVNTVREVYRPRRFYKRKNAPPEDIETKVQITLLEYGLAHMLSFSSQSTESDVADEKFSELEIQDLMNDLTTTTDDNVEHVELNEEDRLQLMKHYAALQSEMEDGGLKSKEEKKIWALEQQKQIIIDRSERLEQEINSLENSITENNRILESIKSKEKEAEEALKELEADESNYNDIKEIEDLVILNDKLKSQEIQFKENCKLELAKLKAQIEEKENSKPVENNHELYTKDIEEETEKMKVMRLQLAKRNRATATIQRKLDEIPSQAELSQYQRRFLELYNQVAAKHKETKQYYTLYNTLDDIRSYVTKELSLLNSICDSYPEALSSNSSREEFLQQFEVVVDGVKQSKLKVESKLLAEKEKRDRLSSVLQGLVEQQRRYVTAVKQLSVECRKQEALLSRQQQA